VNNQLIIRPNLQQSYADVYTPEALEILSFLSFFNTRIHEKMALRLQKRDQRNKEHLKISFLNPESFIEGTAIKVSDARKG